MIVIVDYGLGNLASVKNAFDKLGIPVAISSSPKEIKKADGLILPGVGAAGIGMKNLKKSGLDKVIKNEVLCGKPILGICLGMQLLLDFSEEGQVECLGLLKGKVKKFKKVRKIPQIGWNQVNSIASRLAKSPRSKKSFLFQDIPENSYFYFVNSFYCDPEDKNIVTGVTKYGVEFCSVFERGNIYATQFHPEKSGEVGFKLLKNFVELSRKGEKYVI